MEPWKVAELMMVQTVKSPDAVLQLRVRLRVRR